MNTDYNLQSLVEFYGQVIADRAGTELRVACADNLDVGLLDYGLESLNAIDQYLLIVHGAQEGIPTIAYVNTIMGTAIYVGEVIRRTSPSTEYRWAHAQESTSKNTSATRALSDLSDLVLLSNTYGTVLAQTEPVLRRIRHGNLAPTVNLFAVNRIRFAWAAMPA